MTQEQARESDGGREEAEKNQQDGWEEVEKQRASLQLEDEYTVVEMLRMLHAAPIHPLLLLLLPPPLLLRLMSKWKEQTSGDDRLALRRAESCKEGTHLERGQMIAKLASSPLGAKNPRDESSPSLSLSAKLEQDPVSCVNPQPLLSLDRSNWENRQVDHLTMN